MAKRHELGWNQPRYLRVWRALARRGLAARWVLAVASLALVACGPGFARKPAIVTPTHAARVRILFPVDAADELFVQFVDEDCVESESEARRAFRALQLELQSRLQMAGFPVVVSHKSAHDVALWFKFEMDDCWSSASGSGSHVFAKVRVALEEAGEPVVRVVASGQDLQHPKFGRRLADRIMNEFLSSPELLRLAEQGSAGGSSDASTTSRSPRATACAKDTDCEDDLVCDEGRCAPSPDR